MFLLSRHSKSTCMVHVGGAAWLYYICRIVHLELVFRQRKLLIIPYFFTTLFFNHKHIIYHCIPLFLPPCVLSVSFSRWRWVDVCARTRSAWTCWWQSPCYRVEKRSETLCHQFLLKSHLDIFVTPSLFFYFILFYIFFYKLRACIYKFLLLVCICHRPFHHYQYYSLYIFK